MKGGELSETARDWASVPGELLREIAERFESIDDYVRFGAVCRSWHSLTTSSLNNDKPKFLPWLMLAEKKDSDMRGFYNLSTDKVFEIELPEIRGRKCWGSPFGWLITYGLDLEIYLLNPLSRARLPLPPQRTFTDQYPEEHTNSKYPEYLRNIFIYKIVLCSNCPTSNDFVAMAIYSEFWKLAYAKPGEEAWHPIQCDKPFDDMIYFDGNFFAVANPGGLFICEDFYGDHPVTVEFAASPPLQFGGQKYLVDLGGDLCMVCRSNVRLETDDDTEEFQPSLETDDFEVFKLDMQKRNWERVKELGDWCLFLGNNYSFSIKASDYSGCRSNCIYFTDDYENLLATLGSDMGIFNCENKEADYFQDLPDMESSFSPSLWITPCLQ